MSQTLPATAYIKMIDIWMIFCMLYPFAEIALVWTKDFFKKRAVSKQGKPWVDSERKENVGNFRSSSIDPLFRPKLVQQCVRERKIYATQWHHCKSLESFCKLGIFL